MPWYDEFNSMFFLSGGTLVFALIGVIAKQCYKSKCRQVRLCCGFINIERDTSTEEDIDIENSRTIRRLDSNNDIIPSRL
jgi:hypothetical protein